MSNSKHLRSLVRQVMEDDGLTYAAVADRATALGHKLARSTVHDVATDPNPVRPITYAQIEALAVGLGITPEMIASAVAADLGVIDATAPAGVRLLLASVEGLSDDDLRVLRQMAERLSRPAE